MSEGSRTIALMVSSFSRNSPIWKPDSIAAPAYRKPADSIGSGSGIKTSAQSVCGRASAFVSRIP